MLLLPIAALALLVFFFILLLMTAANSCEDRERRRPGGPVEHMFRGLNQNSLTENARLVCATQLPALEYLASNSAAGIPSASLPIT